VVSRTDPSPSVEFLVIPNGLVDHNSMLKEGTM